MTTAENGQRHDTRNRVANSALDLPLALQPLSLLRREILGTDDVGVDAPPTSEARSRRGQNTHLRHQCSEHPVGFRTASSRMTKRCIGLPPPPTGTPRTHSDHVSRYSLGSTLRYSAS
jgi:hypothetical protein